MENTKPTIGITMGDPAGVGPELCLHVLRERRVMEYCMPLVFGDAAVLRRVASATGLPEPQQIVPLRLWADSDLPAQPAVVDCGAIGAHEVEPGKIQAGCGRAAFSYVEAAVRYAMAGEIAGIATAPINKEALHAAGVPYPGHTEMLGALTGSRSVCMMLSSDDLVVSMVTTHIGLAQVPGALTTERILDVIELTASTMGRVTNGRPRIGVCGLNPHAGEHGLFGREEEEKIEPAIAQARARGLDVEGPIPPDTAFVAPRRQEYAAIVCMYHDQGHIPFKMLAFDTGVNITLGLPIVRASVDHGTAFDIAWTGKANPESMVQAIRWAARLGSRT